MSLPEEGNTLFWTAHGPAVRKLGDYMRWDILHTAPLPARTHSDPHCITIHAVCVKLMLRRMVLIGELLPGSRYSHACCATAATAAAAFISQRQEGFMYTAPTLFIVALVTNAPSALACKPGA
jgi:hypothetical protein